MARLPSHLHPFGYERIADTEVAWADLWAQQPETDLQPSAVNLERLDPQGWRALMSWFSGSSRSNNRDGSSAVSYSRRASGHSRSRRRRDSPGQLSFELGDF